MQRKQKACKCCESTKDCRKGSEYCVAVDYCCCILQNTWLSGVKFGEQQPLEVAGQSL